LGAPPHNPAAGEVEPLLRLPVPLQINEIAVKIIRS